MKKVYKYELSITNEQEVMLPDGYSILSVQMQKEDLEMWVLVTPENESRKCTLRIYGTGHIIPEDYLHIFLGTVQQFGGTLVWHVFEVIK